jgi:AmmeMemoRadiSam system protein B
VYTETLEGVIQNLDESYLLENTRFRKKIQRITNEFKAAKTRAAFHAGVSYPGEPEPFAAMMDGFYRSAVQGPSTIPETGSLAGIIAPHIDLKTGGPASARAYHHLERFPEIRLFIILGTAHGFQNAPFVLTRKSFETPMGAAQTDTSFVDALASACDMDPTEEEESHRTEHSIEFQVLFLQHLLEGKRDFRIVPILCGNFESMLVEKEIPGKGSDFHRFTTALQDTVAHQDEGSVCYIAGADLAHIGPRYGDPDPVSESHLSVLKAEDKAMLDTVLEPDLEGFFQSIAKDGDRRRVCGFPPILTMLASMTASTGHLTDYTVWHDQQSGSAVSFAGCIFLRDS